MYEKNENGKIHLHFFFLQLRNLLNKIRERTSMHDYTRHLLIQTHAHNNILRVRTLLSIFLIHGAHPRIMDYNIDHQNVLNTH